MCYSLCTAQIFSDDVIQCYQYYPCDCDNHAYLLGGYSSAGSGVLPNSGTVDDSTGVEQLKVEGNIWICTCHTHNYASI